MTDEHVVVYLS